MDALVGEIYSKIKDYLELFNKIKGKNEETLKNSPEYRTFLSLEHELKEYVLEGDEFLAIIQKLENNLSEKNKELLEQLCTYENKVQKIRRIISEKKGKIVEDLENILN